VISDLTLSHFRSHRWLTLALDGRPVAIFGPNGAGKTNILEAVSMLSPGRGLRRAGPGEIARRPEALGWKVSAVVRGPDGAHEVETWAEGTGPRSVSLDGKAATQAALGRLLRVLWLIPAMDRLWIEAAEGRRRFLDRIAMSFDPSHADATLAYEKAMRDRNRLLKDQIRDARWFDALEAQMAASGAAIAVSRRAAIARITAAQDGARTAFPAAELAIVAPEDADPVGGGEEDLRVALATGRGRDMAAGRTLAGPHRADLSAVYAAKGVAADQCSTGEQKALLVGLALAHARMVAQTSGVAPLALLDEIAAHFDPTRRAALFAELSALSGQVWVTGADPAAFADLPATTQRLVVTPGRVAPA
jgi:DNA replication and repair protein RecF